MDPLASNEMAGLWESHDPPCLSLYQPTHRHFPENQQDPIRFRNLIKEMEESLRQKYPTRNIQLLLKSFHALADNHDFWNHTLDGLVVLSASNMFRVYKLQRQVAELVIVANTFHTKPLIRILQSSDRYQVLGLNLKEIRLFEGNRDVLDEVELAKGVPRTLVEALGAELTESHLTVASYGMGAGGPAMHHGHGAKKDEIDIDAERFFRAVDRTILKYHSRPTGLPLLLAALPEHHYLFRQISHNPFLMNEGIDIYPDTLSVNALRDRAWRVVRPQYLARLTELIEEFCQAKSKGLGADELMQVAEVAITGRIATLLIEADRLVPGRIEAVTGKIKFENLTHPEIDDLLDDLGELVLKKGGHVVVVPADQMPTKAGAAATYRF